MEDVVKIIYGKDRKVEECLFKYFFSMAGILCVEDFENNESKEIRYIETVKYIKDEKKGSIIFNRGGREISLTDCSPQKNVCEVKTLKDIFTIVIRYLFENNEEINSLAEIFWNNSVWMAGWLFEEFEKSKSYAWDRQIELICNGMINSINTNKGFNQEYMTFYCKYIVKGLKYRNFEESHYSNDHFLKQIRYKCNNAKNQNEKYAWNYLAIRVCELSPTTNKDALSFWKNMNINKSDSFFEIGQIYMDLFGESEKAMKYYTKAYKCGNCKYNLLFEIGKIMQQQHQWADALITYNKVIDIISSGQNNELTSVSELEYYYESMLKKKEIYHYAIDGMQAEKNILEQIKYLKKSVENKNLFNELTNAMCEQKYNDIKDLIYNQIKM